MDDVASKGYSLAADAYQASRPAWPLEAIHSAFAEWQLRPEEGLVVDLAAGTGHLTEQLLKVCPRVLAVEPVAAMRAHIRDADTVEGTAEGIPLDDAQALAVFVGEAFHWFDYTAALRELARIIRPGGGLAVMWNTPVDVPQERELQRAIGELVKPYAYHPKGHDLFAGDRREEREWLSVAGWESFHSVQYRQHFHEQEITRAGLVALVGSWSFVAALDERVRTQVLHETERLLIERGIDRYRQRWRCDTYRTKRR